MINVDNQLPSEGFESGSLSGAGWTSVGGAAVSSTQARGSYSLYAPSGNNYTVYGYKDVANIAVGHRLYYRGYVYIVSDTPSIILLTNDDGTSVFGFAPGSGSPPFYFGAGALGATGSVNWPYNEWVRVEVKILLATDGSSGYFEARIYHGDDATPFDTITDSGHSSTSASTTFRVQLKTYNPGDVYLDDVALGDLDWIGPAGTTKTFVGDDFNRADGALGSEWSYDNSGLVISGHNIVISAISTVCDAVFGQQFAADCQVSLVLPLIPFGAGFSFYLCLRLTRNDVAAFGAGNGQYGYFAYFSATDTYIFKITDGSAGYLAYTAHTWGVSGHKIVFKITGDLLEIYDDTTFVMSYNDSTYNNAGYVGIETLCSNFFGGVPTFDNFIVTELGGAGGGDTASLSGRYRLQQ